ncbi:MAG: DNA (cytosine-5-)-methyltransferase [bacterium]|nr:DNA (cytosine-5-)-methyltransferase [bacterium]
MTKLKLLDLFSGIGGFSLGLERTGGFETVAFCEYDKKARLVLNKHWPDVPIYEDVRTLEHDGTIDIITGGFPCQPFSVAGKQKGKEDDRHLWPAMFNLIQKHRPTWVIGENVAGLIALGLDSVLADLESENYAVRTFIIPAVAVDAKHRRDRLWIVAHSERTRLSGYKQKGSGICSQQTQARPIMGDGKLYKGFKSIRTGVRRKTDGLSRGVDRVKSLGNAVVPQIVEIIGNAILEAEKTYERI